MKQPFKLPLSNSVDLSNQPRTVFSRFCGYYKLM